MNMAKYDFWFWKNLVNEDEIKQINHLCEKHKEKETGDKPAPNVVKTASVKNIQVTYLKDILKTVNYAWMNANHEHFGYNLFPMLDESLWNINDYKKDDEYGWHTDSSTNDAYDIKLTAILNISDESYEGGNFWVFSDGAFREVDLMLLPGSSILLAPKLVHRVSPVTKGIRKTLSYWFTGPKFI